MRSIIERRAEAGRHLPEGTTTLLVLLRNGVCSGQKPKPLPLDRDAFGRNPSECFSADAGELPTTKSSWCPARGTFRACYVVRRYGSSGLRQ